MTKRQGHKNLCGCAPLEPRHVKVLQQARLPCRPCTKAISTRECLKRIWAHAASTPSRCRHPSCVRDAHRSCARPQMMAIMFGEMIHFGLVLGTIMMGFTVGFFALFSEEETYGGVSGMAGGSQMSWLFFADGPASFTHHGCIVWVPRRYVPRCVDVTFKTSPNSS